MRRALIVVVAPIVVLAGIAISRGVRGVQDIKQTIETWADNFEHSAEPVAMNIGFLPMYVDGDRIGKLQTVVVQRSEPGAVDSLLILVRPGADGIGDYAQCSFRFDPDAFDQSGPMGFRHAVHCVTADDVAADGLVRFGSVVFQGIGHQATLYLDAGDLPCAHMSGSHVEACTDLQRDLTRMKRELRENLRVQVRNARRDEIRVDVDMDQINAEIQQAMQEAQRAMEEARVQLDAARESVVVKVEIKN